MVLSRFHQEMKPREETHRGVHGLMCFGIPVQGCKQKYRLPLKKIAILPLAGKRYNILNNVRITKNAIAGLKIMVEFEAAKNVFERKYFM